MQIARFDRLSNLISRRFLLMFLQMIKNWIVIIVSCVTVNENHYQNVSIVLGQKEGENEVPHPTF